LTAKRKSRPTVAAPTDPGADKAYADWQSHLLAIGRLIASPLSDLLMKAHDDARNLIASGKLDHASVARLLVAMTVATNYLRDATEFAEGRAEHSQ
jgi:hypothetical protein